MIAADCNYKPSELELAVVASFFPRPTGKVLKTIECRCTCPTEYIYNILQQLEKKGVVQKVWLGKTLAYDLNVDSYDAFAGYLLYVRLRKAEIRAKEKKTALALNELVKKVAVDSLVVCESFASDTKLLCLSEDMNRELENIVGAIISLVSKRYEVKFETQFFSNKQFYDFKNQMYDFFAQIGDYAIPWSGAETYYKLVYKSSS